MTDYTAAEVLAGLEGVLDRAYDWESIGWYLKHDFGGHIELRGEQVEVLVVDSQSGGEGDYDIGTYVILGVGDQYFRKTGHYMSHYGDDWDGPFAEVRSVEKTITVYEWKEQA